MSEQYKHPICRGFWALGTACGMCERCKATMPYETLYKLESETVEDQKILLADKDARIEELETGIAALKETVDAEFQRYVRANDKWNAAEARVKELEASSKRHAEDCDQYMAEQAVQIVTLAKRVEELENLPSEIDDLADRWVGDDKTKGVIQFVSGFVKDRIAARVKKDQQP
jgi:hypothetical protein